MRLSKVSLAAILALIASGSVLHAQVDSTPCSYVNCALRMEPAFWGPVLVRGVQEDRVGRIGWFGSGVSIMAGRSDSSGIYARRYTKNDRISGVLALVSAAGVLTASLRAERPAQFFGNDDASLVAVGVGIVALYASIPFTLRARRSLARAVWWYNAELARD